MASSAMRVPSASAQIAAQLPDLVENLAVATERLNTTIDRMERYMALAVPCSKRWTACCRNWKRLSRRATMFIEACPAFRQLGCPAFSGLLNLRSLCGELRIQVFGADFAWCPVAECGVNSSLIVEQFDVAGNVLLRFLP